MDKWDANVIKMNGPLEIIQLTTPPILQMEEQRHKKQAMHLQSQLTHSMVLSSYVICAIFQPSRLKVLIRCNPQPVLTGKEQL